MALIKCPECEQSVSDKASKCPKCGYPIQEYLSGKTKEAQTESVNETSVKAESSVDSQQTPAKKDRKKKLYIALIAVCVVVVVVLGVHFGSGFFAPKLIVEDIAISKWRLTDSTDYVDYYEGTVSSEQKNPFIAVIGRYRDEASEPYLVYMEDGKGVVETSARTNEDPSIKYRAIGYLGGESVEMSDIQVEYNDINYNDNDVWFNDDYTSCTVLISIDMNNSKNGFLICDVINKTNYETERNMIVDVINGKAEFYYYSHLPYEARSISISVDPKFFCESSAITEENYVIKKAYSAEKDEGELFNRYSGEVTLSFADYADGFVLYTRELKEGGEKENRNIVENSRKFLHAGECTLKTYDSVDADQTILMPKYEFNIIGYVTWIPLEKETK